MAYSRVIIPGDGTTTLITVGFALGYINKDHVRVHVEGEVDGAGDIVYRAFSFTTPSLMQVVGTPAPIGKNYIAERIVPKETLIVDWENDDPLTAENLNKSQKQAMMMAHEALDGVSTAVKTADGSEGPLITEGTAGQGLVWDANGNLIPTDNSGAGNMVTEIYDPQGIAADAFNRANHTGTQTMATISDLAPALDAKVSKSGDTMTGTLGLYTAEDASSSQIAQGRLLPKVGQYLTYLAARTYTTISSFFSQPALTLEATEIHSAGTRGTKGSLWSTTAGGTTSAKRITWDETGIRGLVAGTTMQHLAIDPVSWGASESAVASVNELVFGALLANVDPKVKIPGHGRIFNVVTLPDVTRFVDIGFRVGSVIHTSTGYWKGLTTGRISNGMIYQAWAQDKCYMVERQIRVWCLEKESHADGTGRIVLYTSDDNGSSFAPGEYLQLNASGETVWCGGYNPATSTEYLFVRVPAGTTDVPPYTYTMWSRTLVVGPGTTNYYAPFTLTPITFPVPSGFTLQPVMIHSFTIGHSGSLVIGASYGEGAVIMRSTNGGTTWVAAIIETNPDTEEPTVTYDPVTQRYYGFTRNGNTGQPKYWHSDVNSLATISRYTAPSGTFGTNNLTDTCIPLKIYNGRIYAWTSYRNGTLEGTGDDEITSMFLLDMPVTAGNIWAQATSKVYRLGTIPHREGALAASACGQGSVVMFGSRIHIYFGMEERTGTTPDRNRIANIYQITIPLIDYEGAFDFRDELSDNRAYLGPLRKIPQNGGYVAYTDDAFDNVGARVGGRPQFAPYRTVIQCTGSATAGVFTPVGWYGDYLCDTYVAGATTDLISISTAGAMVGDVISLRTASASRKVTIKHLAAGGNIYLNGQSDKLLSSGFDSILLKLMLAGSSLFWVQVAFSDNAV